MLIRGIALLSVAAAGLATVVAIGTVAGGNHTWSAFGFSMLAGGAGVALCCWGVAPSWVRYYKTRRPDDRTKLQLAGVAFLVLLAEAVALQVLPKPRRVSDVGRQVAGPGVVAEQV